MPHDAGLIQELMETAHAAVDIARPETLRYFRKPGLMTANKTTDGFDPVTEGDRAAERAMRELLARKRPDDAVLGEEFPPVSGTSGLTWILDPIDGTRAYMSGAPSWGILLAVADEDGPILGIVDQPYIGERFVGGPDGAWLDGPAGRIALETRDTSDLSEAILFTTYPEVGTEEESAAFWRLAARVKLTRYGLDCYAYALLAAGQIDLVVEAGLQTYDIQGPMAVVRAAGGIVTDWQGGDASNGGRVIAAANRALHEQALALLAT
ncbi:histidinol phosphatase-like enzyme (inositol monophosphatase family) [Palleronia aestuarii]|uniref:Histidinol phosphatase-like enzyme (Inositol monophosphatase family) n=1 Tax=Palleronia aestuarii TaxID=568105 RepID=A0A2W7Q9N8_9RHOB|nr:inositol monophosphatase family protein [Palleronia aestuarii]PZX18439.1 histidinol phosphatase-like enzyme (inositol monophosphatase family) [Palleronia aestuarii]